MTLAVPPQIHSKTDEHVTALARSRSYIETLSFELHCRPLVYGGPKGGGVEQGPAAFGDRDGAADAETLKPCARPGARSRQRAIDITQITLLGTIGPMSALICTDLTCLWITGLFRVNSDVKTTAASRHRGLPTLDAQYVK